MSRPSRASAAFTVRPRHLPTYLSLHPLTNSLASLDILRTTRTITLNAAANLTLAPASLSTSETLTLAPTASTYDAPTERATFAFAQDLPAGSKATLSVGFSAPLDGSMTGYYASKWDKGVYALTQFEVGPLPLPCLKFYVC